MIYVNSEVISRAHYHMDINDRGLLLGDGLFETLRVYNGQVFALERHYRRLIEGLAKLKLAIPHTLPQVEIAIAKLLLANKLSEKHAVIRITVTRGVGPRGLLPPTEQKPTIIITASECSMPTHAPMKLHISKTTRRNEYSPLSNLKSLGYLDNILAKMEAVEHQADDAILLNTQNYVASVSAGNIFLVTKDNKIITPRIEDGILPGITRQYVMDICNNHGIPLLEKSVTIADLLASKEVFVTNTLIEIQSVISINNQLVNDGSIGGLTSRILVYYHSIKEIV